MPFPNLTRVRTVSFGSSRSTRNGEHRNHPVSVSVSITFDKIRSWPWKRSTAEINWVVIGPGFFGEPLEELVTGWREAVKESEKKEREPLGNVEMTWRTRVVLVDGHVAWQARDQRWSPEEESAWSSEHVAAAEAREAPSRRARMWASITSGWTTEIAAAPPHGSAGDSPEVQAMEGDFGVFS